MNRPRPQPRQATVWRLEKKLSLAIVVALVGQAVSAIWFASKLDSRVGVLERRTLEIGETLVADRTFQIEQRMRVWNRIESQAQHANAMRAEMAGVSARLEALTQAIDRLSRRYDAIRPPQPNQSEPEAD